MMNDSNESNVPTLNALLTEEELQVLAQKLNQVLRAGFGEITITVQKHHVRFVKVTSSHELPDRNKLRAAYDD